MWWSFVIFFLNTFFCEIISQKTIIMIGFSWKRDQKWNNTFGKRIIGTQDLTQFENTNKVKLVR